MIQVQWLFQKTIASLERTNVPKPLQEEDNLSIVDEMAGPKVSFIVPLYREVLHLMHSLDMDTPERASKFRVIPEILSTSLVIRGS